MKSYFLGAGAVVVLVSVGAGVYISSGAFDIAADSPHSAFVYSIIETTRDRAINTRASQVEMPATLNDAERIRRGSGNYNEMCVDCHLKPGKTDSEIRKGLYPVPPDLTKPESARAANADLNAKRQFWVIKHGVKASGMSAWGKGGMDDIAIWDIVAFLQKMPSMSKEEYDALVKKSDGHSHGGLDSHGDDHHGDKTKNVHKKRDDGHKDHTH